MDVSPSSGELAVKSNSFAKSLTMYFVKKNLVTTYLFWNPGYLVYVEIELNRIGTDCKTNPKLTNLFSILFCKS